MGAGDVAHTLMNKSCLMGLVAVCIASFGCVPVQPSEQQLIGRWRVVWECGTEDLELKPDASYVQGIEYSGGGHATHAGTWRVTPKESRLVGAHVVLQDAMEFCTVFGKRLTQPERRDRKLETVWEWGRVILSFNPDSQGFERQ
jgi:hypothetical protein